MSNAGTHQRVRQHRAESATATERDVCITQLLLTVLTDARKAHLSTVSLQSRVHSFSFNKVVGTLRARQQREEANVLGKCLLLLGFVFGLVERLE